MRFLTAMLAAVLFLPPAAAAQSTHGVGCPRHRPAWNELCNGPGQKSCAQALADHMCAAHNEGCPQAPSSGSGNTVSRPGSAMEGVLRSTVAFTLLGGTLGNLTKTESGKKLTVEGAAAGFALGGPVGVFANHETINPVAGAIVVGSSAAAGQYAVDAYREEDTGEKPDPKKAALTGAAAAAVTLGGLSLQQWRGPRWPWLRKLRNTNVVVGGRQVQVAIVW